MAKLRSFCSDLYSLVLNVFQFLHWKGLALALVKIFIAVVKKKNPYIQVILVPFIVHATCLLESCFQIFIGSRMKVFMLQDELC